jgi:c-di-GMP-binding flagellar brake protein YcgR
MRKEEKRRARRINEKDKIAIELISDNEDLQTKKIFYVLSKDISQFGVKIQTDTFFPVNSSLKLKIFLENPQSLVKLQGKIRWIECHYAHESYKMGIEFENLSSNSKKILEECVSGFIK